MDTGGGDVAEVRARRCGRLWGGGRIPSFDNRCSLLTRLQGVDSSFRVNARIMANDAMEFGNDRRFEVLGTLGKGGFGTVYKALLHGEGGFSKIVALKVLNADVQGIDEVAVRLRDEARVLGLVQHRAIVHVDGLVRLDGRWAVVMEYVDGVDLQALLDRGPVPLGPALEVLAETASALRAAHEQAGPDGRPLGLVHRDIKPSNLQLTAHGEVKILDFGTARADFASREALTRSVAFGTLDYMSPERLDFQDGPSGDVYALGVVLVEMLTGQRFGRTWARPEKHEAKRAAALEALGRDHPADVVALVRELLAFDPDDRPTLRSLEQRARQAGAAAGGPWLAEWCAEVVPRVRLARSGGEASQATPAAHAPDSATTWVPDAPRATPPPSGPAPAAETARAESPGPPAPAPSRPWWRPALVAAALVLVASAAVLALVVGRYGLLFYTLFIPMNGDVEPLDTPAWHDATSSCAERLPLSAIDDALIAAEGAASGAPAEFLVAHAAAEQALGCARSVISWETARRWHEVDPIAAHRIDRDGGRGAIGAYRALAGYGWEPSLPESLDADTRAELMWAWRQAEESPRPEHVATQDADWSLFVDGMQAYSYPVDGPAILQWVGPEGTLEANLIVRTADEPRIPAALRDAAERASRAPSGPHLGMLEVLWLLVLSLGCAAVFVGVLVVTLRLATVVRSN